MIEPTEAQVAAFKEAWEAEARRQLGRASGEVGGEFDRPIKIGDRTRAGLRAALNVPSES